METTGQLEEVANLYLVVFMLVLLRTRSLLWATVLTTSLYLFLAMFRFSQVPASRAQQVLHPGSDKVSVVANRGGGHDAPENTIAAIREAKKNGAAGVELDLEFSADGVAILMHDKTVDRTTNGSGPVSQMRLSDLRKLDAAAKHRLREKFAGEKIPTLEEAVEECIKLQLVIYFDVKDHPDEAAAALKELYKKYPVLYNSSIVCSFEPKVIYRMRQSDPEVVTALTLRRLVDRSLNLSFLFQQEQLSLTMMTQALDMVHDHVLYRLCGVSAFLLHKNAVCSSGVKFWAERGVDVVAWTLNSKVEKVYYHKALHVNYITDSLVEEC